MAAALNIWLFEVRAETSFDEPPQLLPVIVLSARTPTLRIDLLKSSYATPYPKSLHSFTTAHLYDPQFKLETVLTEILVCLKIMLAALFVTLPNPPPTLPRPLLILVTAFVT